MKVLLLIFLLFGIGLAWGESDPRLARLEAAYNRVHQEQQVSYQQFLMVQELRRRDAQETPPPSPVQGYSSLGRENGPSVDYDENQRRRQARQDRLQAYDREINQAYARYLELGAQKRVLLEQIEALDAAAKP